MKTCRLSSDKYPEYNLHTCMFYSHHHFICPTKWQLILWLFVGWCPKLVLWLTLSLLLWPSFMPFICALFHITEWDISPFDTEDSSPHSPNHLLFLTFALVCQPFSVVNCWGSTSGNRSDVLFAFYLVCHFLFVYPRYWPQYLHSSTCLSSAMTCTGGKGDTGDLGNSCLLQSTHHFGLSLTSNGRLSP